MEHDPLSGGCNALVSLSECRELREHSILVIRHGEALGVIGWKVLEKVVVGGWLV